MLKEGDKAPEFTLKDQNGKLHSLSEYKGKTVVLYFYPKDDTPGCTIEACKFRDSTLEFSKKNAAIIGISKDDEKSHANFAKKFGLPFVLLSDPRMEVIKAYGAAKEKSMFGNTFLGIKRCTVIIDEKGNVKQIFWDVNPEGHAKEILALL